jgi:hypothetical protein
MKFDRPLDEVLGARSKVALLRLLVRTRGEQTGSELARQVSLDVKTCHTALQELAEHGVIGYRRAGAAILYRLNDRHFLVKALLQPLFERESTGVAAYAKDLAARVRAPLVALILFGSVVRKEERAKSDVDLVWVVPSAPAIRPTEDKVDRAASELAVRYGNPPQVIVLDRESFRLKAQKGDSFISEVMRTGRVLKGKPFAEILKHVS